jgi:ribosomal protein S18 acetylase RimI-like enzyme
MIAIRPLLKFDPAELKRVMPGYTSHERYDVNFTESEAGLHVSFELSLVSLPQPFVKSWLDDRDDDTLAMYERSVETGLSRGVYDGDTLIALAIAETQPWNQTLWVWEFGVAEKHRGKGIGQHLMQAMIAVAAQQGLRAVSLETQTSNVAAIRFYRRVGFDFDGIRLSFYSNDDLERGEVALFMRRSIDP